MNNLPPPFPNPTYRGPPPSFIEPSLTLDKPPEVVEPLMGLGYKSVKLVCPYCKSVVSTRTEAEVPCVARIMCTLCCLVGCCLCSCIPYLKMYHVRHDCPHCGSYVGSSCKKL